MAYWIGDKDGQGDAVTDARRTGHYAMGPESKRQMWATRQGAEKALARLRSLDPIATEDLRIFEGVSSDV